MCQKHWNTQNNLDVFWWLKMNTVYCDPVCNSFNLSQNSDTLAFRCTCFGSTYTKIGTIQRRLAWPLRKDDTQNREAFHIFWQPQAPGLQESSVGNLKRSPAPQILAIVAEWLRRLTRNQIPYGSAGSNPADCESFFYFHLFLQIYNAYWKYTQFSRSQVGRVV